MPESAVIDTGTRKVVYVESEPGVFEGREVVLGPRIGDRFPVLEGLAPGEKVAAAGAFLTSRAAQPAAGERHDRVEVRTGYARRPHRRSRSPRTNTARTQH